MRLPLSRFSCRCLLPDLGYKDSQIKAKQSLRTLTVGRGHKREKYKPDYSLMFRGAPRCVVDAKGTSEDLSDWIEQCSGYCLALNRKYDNRNPVRYFLLSNGLSTVLYEWDKDEPLLELDFSDFTWGNPKYEHLKDSHWCIEYFNFCRGAARRRSIQLQIRASHNIPGTPAICNLPQSDMEIRGVRPRPCVPCVREAHVRQAVGRSEHPPQQGHATSV